MELRDALAQISEIRLRMARGEVFRGYRAGPAAFSGLVAVLAAVAQAAFVREPAQDIALYVALWVGAAAVSALTAGLAVSVHYRRTDALERQTGWLLLEQLLPSVVAGALLTLALLRFAPESLWLLPGLWQILYGLGLFAASRLLPRGIAVVAAFYLATGLLCLALARGDQVLSPWAMGGPFGIGQLLAAGVLYLSLERDDDG